MSDSSQKYGAFRVMAIVSKTSLRRNHSKLDERCNAAGLIRELRVRILVACMDRQKNAFFAGQIGWGTIQ
jgi:hypothetical protein